MIIHHPITSRLIEVPKTEAPFNELILSWNGFRPSEGSWIFSISLFQNQWSAWMNFAEWGKGIQRTFSCDPPDSFAKTYLDVAFPKTGLCTGYKIQVEGAPIESLRSITVSIGQPSTSHGDLPSVQLSDVPATSQQILKHQRAKDLCSPTSTASAINFLLKAKLLDPALFAEEVRDQNFNIYGNWILNTAAAFEALQGRYRTYVARLSGFEAIHAQLMKQLPVVVSVKGPLPGAPLPYAHGHLILVTGYDREAKRVHCMDPAYPTDEQTITSYPLDEFLKAWTDRRKNPAYLFEMS